MWPFKKKLDIQVGAPVESARTVAGERAATPSGYVPAVGDAFDMPHPVNRYGVVRWSVLEVFRASDGTPIAALHSVDGAHNLSVVVSRMDVKNVVRGGGKASDDAKGELHKLFLQREAAKAAGDESKVYVIQEAMDTHCERTGLKLKHI